MSTISPGMTPSWCFCNNEHPVEGQLQGTLVCPMIQHIRIDWDPVWFLQQSVEDQSQSSKMIKVTILLLICAPLLAYAASSGKSHKMMLFFHPGPEGNLIISMIVQVRNVERRHSVQILTSSVMKASGLSFDPNILSFFIFTFSFALFNFKFNFHFFLQLPAMAREERSRSPLLLWVLHRRGGGSIKGEEIHIKMAENIANIANMCFFQGGIRFGVCCEGLERVKRICVAKS